MTIISLLRTLIFNIVFIYTLYLGCQYTNDITFFRENIDNILIVCYVTILNYVLFLGIIIKELFIFIICFMIGLIAYFLSGIDKLKYY